MKKIVLCFDGTDSKFGPAPYTNLLKLFRMLEKDNCEDQLCYYQPGIGTSMTVESENIWDIWGTVSNGLDSLIALTLDEHIMNAYKYLMKFYMPGDKIYLFGFSRGAFTARVLTSMISRVGLLNEGLEELVGGAWYIYSAWEYAAQPSQPDYTQTLVDEFKKTFSRETTPEIEFMGLFDTINSVGLFRDRMFPFTTKFKYVKQIRHAVSLDERRGKYKQNLIYPYSYRPSLFSLKSTANQTPKHSRENTNQNTNTNETQACQSLNSDSNNSKISEAKRLMKDIENRLHNLSKFNLQSNNHRRSTASSIDADKTKLLTGEFQELWFPGNHGDVGGGWDPDIHGQFVSNLPLRWMLSEAVKAGVRFKTQSMKVFSERYSSLDSLLSPTHDVLSLYKGKLTHEMSEVERKAVLEFSKSVTQQRKKTPYFRSCETPNLKSREDIISSGVYINSLKRINFDLDQDVPISEIFQYYDQLPKSKVQGFEGRGGNSLLSALAWWTIEFLPLGTKIENEDGEWTDYYIPNLGRSRYLPSYAKLHWSIFWRMKYCFDYNPENIPQYAKDLLQGFERDSYTGSTEDEDEILIKKVIQETRDDLNKWASEGWKIVPDDLDHTLQENGYYN